MQDADEEQPMQAATATQLGVGADLAKFDPSTSNCDATVVDASHRLLNAQRSPASIRRTGQASATKMTTAQLSAVRALWDSCEKAAAARQSFRIDARADGGRSVRCSLINSMNSAAASDG